MAKTTTKKRNIKQFPQSKPAVDDGNVTATALEDLPEEQATPFDPQPAPVTAPEAKQQKIPKILTFFQRVAAIAPEDWGTRAKIKVYRLQPLINRLVGSENKFITIYGEPINEQKLKVDHGSGRYRLYLNFKNPGGDKERELDTVEIDILDPAFPPKINDGEWMDDPRNKQWAWAKPPSAQPAAAAAAASTLAQFTDVLRATNEMRKEIREELTPPQSTQPAQPGPSVDPWSAAEKILQMRSDNPMVQILMQRMEQMDKAAEASRQREFELQKELREQARSPHQANPADKPKTLLEQATELADAAGKLKTIFNGPEENVIPRGKISPWQVARDVIPEIANSKIMEAVAAKMMAGPTVMPPMNGNGAQPRQNSTIPPLARFIENVGTPAMLEYFNAEGSGSDFADWLYSGFPTILPQLQGFTHPALPGLVGAPAIVQAYKNTPNVWPQLASREPQFIEFINEFCQWRPDQDEDEEVKAEPDDDGWTQGSERGPEHEERVS